MDLTEVKQIIERLERDFNPEVAKDLDVVIQYHISGEDSGDYKIRIKDRTCKIDKGIHDSPNVTISMADKTWLGLFNNTVNPMLAFTTKKIKVKGDFSLAMNIQKIFTP
ncbi:MAG: SCP2 sterol-binding domain-containing protein [Proteobacteria bacterium]|nr:SCP2 sterol-binding domain-containing protein [Pseudomonadota bacterium]